MYNNSLSSTLRMTGYLPDDNMLGITMRLPMEVIVIIGSQLDHRSILSLALSARSVFLALETVLNMERDIRKRYREVDLGSEHSYHKLLRSLLFDDRLAGYVVSLTCSEDFRCAGDEACSLYPEDAMYLAEGLEVLDTETRILFDRRLAQMSWFSGFQRAKLHERLFTSGGESAVLAALLCMMVELRCLRPPLQWGTDVDELLQSLKTSQQPSQILSGGHHASRTMIKDQPLGKLKLFLGNTSNGVHGTDLRQAIDWMWLPSLTRVVLQRCRSDSIRSDSIPSSPVVRPSDIYLSDSSVTWQGVRDFAKFVKAPCVIRQTYGDAGEYADMGPPTWDHCEIGEDTDGNRSIYVEFRYPNSELHGHDVQIDDEQEALESPAWRSIGHSGVGEVFDWTL